MSRRVLSYCVCREKPAAVRDLIHARDSYSWTYTLKARSEEMILDAQIDYILDEHERDPEAAVQALEAEVWYCLTDWFSLVG